MRTESELNGLKVGVHLRVHGSDGTVNDSPVLELDRDRLVIELHQKPDELHSVRRSRMSTGSVVAPTEAALLSKDCFLNVANLSHTASPSK